MAKIILPKSQSDWGKMGGMQDGAPLITTLGVVGGEILNLIERKGSLALSEIVKQVEWPEAIVMLSAGALIRQSNLDANRFGDQILLAALKEE